MSHPQDRAGNAATTISSIIAEALKAWLRGAPSSLSAVRKEVELYLRGEFDDCARQAREEQTTPDS